MAKTLPVIILKDLVLLPNQSVKLDLINNFSLEVIKLAKEKYSSKVIFSYPNDPLEENPGIEDLPLIVIEAKIEKLLELPNGTTRVSVKGVKRSKVSKYFTKDTYLQARYDYLSLPKVEEIEDLALRREIIKLTKMYIKTSSNASNDILSSINDTLSLDTLTDIVASFIPMNLEHKVYYATELNPLKRAKSLVRDLILELQVNKLDEQISTSLQKRLDKEQKEYILKEKIKEIESEIGLDNHKNADVEEYLTKLDNLSLKTTTKNKIIREIKKYELTNDSSPEFSFIRNYLDSFFSLPWNEEKLEITDLNSITRRLNKTHYGLKQVKERILEYAAMKERNPMLQSPIICLVGPPGVGKSTIASSIAKSLNRDFVKISVGGLNDSGELLGHRRTYVGASPGKIISGLQKCGSKNPIFLIDEVDKMVKDYKGDPASVLLDILDPNLNQLFQDNYLEEPFDLSHVFFILTANHLDDIPVELQDRLEVIEVSSYSTYEKIKLAKDYLLPLIYLDYHLSLDEITIEDEAINYLILNYTNEAGVRDLKRKLEDLYRKIVLESVKKKTNINIKITSKEVKKYLEEKINPYEKPKLINYGLVLGLGVSSSLGGVLQPIESTIYKGKGNVKISGMAGDIMKESLDVVISYLKTKADNYHIPEELFNENDIHIHFLEGGIPKNGPSAGVAITTSLISLLTKRKIANDIAMSGEMSLRGEILPVGGIKEKVIGAYNHGIKTIYLPTQNEVDVKKIPKEILKNIKIIYVSEYSEIYNKLFDTK